MLNQFVLVGRVVEKPTLENDICYIKLAVSRSFKNEKGEYETDIIPIKLTERIKNISEHCNKNDLIGAKGRIQRYNGNDYTANGLPILEMVAEKITFLSSKGGNENE